tara:strand:- start:202 stop:561 length:360 start_codon:yes stop_codon:yes gene_type:complete
MQVKFEESGTPLKRSKNRHGETCEEQLRRMCKNIAEDITAGKEDVHEWMEDVYDIEWITFNDHSYKAARLMVAGGGPNIWVNLQTGTVDGYWGCDKVSHGFMDNLGLDEYCEEMYAGTK